MPVDRVLRVLKYQYIRDLPRTPFPRLNGTLFEDVRNDVKELASQFEIASLEASLDFLTGEYRPRRDLCLLTFDDGLKEHFDLVLPFLAERRIRGVFFLITSCLEEKIVSPEHMNDFLVAALGFEGFCDAFLAKVAVGSDALSRGSVDPMRAAEAYPKDPPETARFKYLVDVQLDPDLRNRALRELFVAHIAAEEEFSSSLYLTWTEARQMQKAGMSMGGHTHLHKPLSSLTPRELTLDLEMCHGAMARNLTPQPVLPFCYPGGDKHSFHVRAVRKIQELGYHCAFCTEGGDNRRGADVFTIGRKECVRALRLQAGA
jgi:peptidoglycan/xylan/chitin deacetylase (PgdA/CDA1 family)